jgi:UDP-2,4-diacetamido-2,4,6-trideoxy-beta-L-altropyranose hydrolase
MLEIMIRADASVEMGSGHVMRCLTLAEELRNNNATVIFISREHEGNLCDFIESKGYEVKRLSGESDAEETFEIIKQHNKVVDYLLVDHYELDHQWEMAVVPSVKYMIAIDDLADRKHYCHLLLDQNYKLSLNHSRYIGLVPSFCRVLEGPQYSLLRKEFRKARENLRERSGTINRILVFFGGSDPSNETMKALEAVLLLDRKNIEVDVIIGASNPHKAEIREFASFYPNINFHIQINNMAELMEKADLAIGAGGSTTWERCSLGLPSIVINIAYNQEEISDAVATTGSIINLGNSRDIEVNHIRNAIENLINDPAGMRTLSNKSLQLVDAKGIDRVLSYLFELDHSKGIESNDKD